MLVSGEAPTFSPPRGSFAGAYESTRGRVNYTNGLPVSLARAVNDIPDGHVLLPVLEQQVHDWLLRVLLEDGCAPVLQRDLECLIRVGFHQQRQEGKIGGVGIVGAFIALG